jgi:arylsulfatase A-like enzyme
MYRDNQPTQEDKGVYCTDLFLREAKNFLHENRERPFLLYVPFNAPHSASNLDPAIRSAAQATDQYKALYPALRDAAGLQASERYGQSAQSLNRAGRRLEYAASITQMDAAIGELLDLLEQFELDEDTLVVFFSDNGGSGGADNGILRGHKGDLFEGGIRVPAIVRFPGRIPAGQTHDGFCGSIDLLPTILEVVKVAKPQELVLDGYSLLPMLSGRGDSPRREMFWQRQGDRAARLGDWKWVDSRKGTGLFNLADDPSEQHDLSAMNLAELQRLQRAHEEWSAEMERAEPRGPFRDF